MIELRLFGVVSLKRDGLELNSLLAQPKRVALLAYLCAATPYGFHRRDSLIGLFWPDSDDTHARASLRNALHNLRRSLGETAIQVRGDDEVCVNADEVWCDARAFGDLVAANRNEEALALYTGELLPGFFIDEAPDFERYLSTLRARLRNLAAEAARRLSESHSKQNRTSDAIAAATHAIELSNYDENDVRRLMTLHALSGNSTNSLKVFDAYAAKMSTELGARPSDDLQRSAERLRKGAKESSHTNDQNEKPFLNSDPLGRIGRDEIQQPEPNNQRRIVRVIASGSLVLLGLLGITAYERRPIFGTGPQVTRRKLTSSGTTLMAALSPDGQFLAFVSQEGDSQRVVLHDVADGAERTLKSVAGAIWSLEWSRDGTRVMAGGFPNVMIFSRLDTTSRTSGPAVPGQVMAYWLPDSVRISLHTAGDRGIVVYDTRSQESRSLPITGSYTWLNEGDWSPSGRVFVVMTESSNPLSSEIRTVDFAGHNSVLVKDSLPLGSPRWAHDGKFVYYARNANSIWRIKTDPTNGEALGTPEQLLDDLQMYPQRFGLVHFSLSSDGHSLVYARGQRFSNLWTITEGDGKYPVTHALTRGTNLLWSPSVSPDGKLVAFAQETDRGGELFTIPFSGGAIRQLTNGARIRRESQIAWSPDGVRIAFATVRRGAAQIWTAEVASGKLRLVGGKPSTATGHLTWAPGARIAYQRERNANVGLMDPSSGAETSLVPDSSSQALHSPQYAPDGSKIAAFWYRGNGPTGIYPSGIYEFDLKHLTHRRIATGLYPRGWSPDAKSIFYQWPQSPVVYRVRVDARKDSSEVALKPPFREAQCFPIGASQPRTFICAVFDFTSDVWRIDNFDRQ